MIFLQGTQVHEFAFAFNFASLIHTYILKQLCRIIAGISM